MSLEKAEKHLDRAAKNVKNIAYLLGVIVLICSSVYLTIDKTFDSKVAQLNATLDGRLTAVEAYTADQIEKNIIKQADKIKGDPSDIKMADIEDAMRYYPMLKDPSQKVVFAYEAVKEYWRTHH